MRDDQTFFNTQRASQMLFIVEGAASKGQPQRDKNLKQVLPSSKKRRKISSKKIGIEYGKKELSQISMPQVAPKTGGPCKR